MIPFPGRVLFQRAKQGANRELGSGPEAHALLESMDAVLRGYGLVNSKQKEQDFGRGAILV